MKLRKQLAAAAVTASIGLGTLAGPANAAVMYAANNATDMMFAIDTNTVSATTLGAAGVNLGFGGLGFAQNGTLYGWTTTTNALYTVNTGTGAWSLVGAGSAGCGDTFDINPVSGEGIVTNICSNQLHTVNLATGATMLKVALSGGSGTPGSAYSETGDLYYIDMGGSIITKANDTTGVITMVGATGISPGTLTNLSYNPDDDRLYAIGLSNAHLYSFNSTTGAGTDLGVIAGLPAGGQMTMSTIQNAAPEPISALLVGLGLAVLGFTRRRKA